MTEETGTEREQDTQSDAEPAQIDTYGAPDETDLDEQATEPEIVAHSEEIVDMSFCIGNAL